jgi:hypothetical protein
MSPDAAGEEAQKPIEHLLRRLLVHIVAARQRFTADILRALPPQAERIGEPLADAAAVPTAPGSAC